MDLDECDEIENVKIPEIIITISRPTISMANQKAMLTISNILKKLSDLNINIIDNKSINDAEVYI